MHLFSLTNNQLQPQLLFPHPQLPPLNSNKKRMMKNKMELSLPQLSSQLLLLLLQPQLNTSLKSNKKIKMKNKISSLSPQPQPHPMFLKKLILFPPFLSFTTWYGKQEKCVTIEKNIFHLKGGLL